MLQGFATQSKITRSHGIATRHLTTAHSDLRRSLPDTAINSSGRLRIFALPSLKIPKTKRTRLGLASR